MFIADLDRPWTDTPFLYQGFVLENDRQLAALKQHCRKVIIDLDKGLNLPERSQLLSGLAPYGRPEVKPVVVAASKPSVLTTIQRKVTYAEKATVDEELPVARAVQARTETVLRDMQGMARAGRALDAPRVREAVTAVTDSVVRNPDAMLLLAKLKEQGANALDRAFGVSIYMITFGRFLQLPREQLDLLGMLGLLQDVGKVRLPQELLAKPGSLSPAERSLCHAHVAYSASILKNTPGLPAELPALAVLHHERYDGSGYPRGLSDLQIGLYGGIAGLVDCFDAMTHPRPYGETLPPSDALSKLYDLRNVKFDGPLIEQFIQCIGIYPVGALVELNSGETGIVIAQNSVRRLQPRVMVVLDAQGNPLRPQVILDLSREPKMAPETPYRIKRTLEKGSVPIDPSEFFLG